MEELVKAYEKLECKAFEILDYIDDDYHKLLSYTTISPDGFIIENEKLKIFYCDFYKNKDRDVIEIPLEFLSEGKWKSYINKMYKEQLKKEEEERRKSEDKDYKLYLELKKRFEK